MADPTKAVDMAMADAVSMSSSSTTVPDQTHQDTPTDDLERAITEKSRRSVDGNVNKIVTALDWTGPDDPDNAENWSGGKKAYHVAYIGWQCFVMYASSWL